MAIETGETTTDSEKAEAPNKFFSDAFTDETQATFLVFTLKISGSR